MNIVIPESVYARQKERSTAVPAPGSSVAPSLPWEPSPTPPGPVQQSTIQGDRSRRYDPVATWEPYVNEAAQETGLDPNLIRALIRHESNGRPSITSGAGAIGLTQLMPDTARELGVDPWDPRQNVLGGARYLKQQLDTFGDLDRALAAYNSGPGNVQKYGGIPPFEETRAYVPAVKGRYAEYSGGAVPESFSTGSGMVQKPAGLGGFKVVIPESVKRRQQEAKVIADTSKPLQAPDLTGGVPEVGPGMFAAPAEASSTAVSPNYDEAGSASPALGELSKTAGAAAQYGARAVEGARNLYGKLPKPIQAAAEGVVATITPPGLKQAAEIAAKAGPSVMKMGGEVLTDAGEALDPWENRKRRMEDKLLALKVEDNKTYEAWRRGDLGFVIDKEIGQFALAGQFDRAEEARKLKREYEKALAIKDWKKQRGVIENLWLSTVEMLPPLLKSGAKSAIPVVGQVLSGSEWAAQGTGDAYDQMVKAGVSPEKASAISPVAGALYAAVEISQFGKIAKLAPSAKKAIAKRAIGEVLKKVAKEKSIDWVTEVEEEVIQQLITDVGVEIGKLASGIKDERLRDTVRRVGGNLGETFVQSVGPMGLLSFLGLAGGTARGAYEIRKDGADGGQNIRGVSGAVGVGPESGGSIRDNTAGKPPASAGGVLQDAGEKGETFQVTDEKGRPLGNIEDVSRETAETPTIPPSGQDIIDTEEEKPAKTLQDIRRDATTERRKIVPHEDPLLVNYADFMKSRGVPEDQARVVAQDRLKNVPRDTQADFRSMLGDKDYKLYNDVKMGIRNNQWAVDNGIMRMEGNTPVVIDPGTLLLVDIDNFKQVNDRWGHKTGDNVLGALGQVLKDSVRGKAEIIRWGGEEILIKPLPGVDIYDIIKGIDAGRKELASVDFGDGLTGVTYSVGVGKGFGETDAQLYQAKKEGRGRTLYEGKTYGTHKTRTIADTESQPGVRGPGEVESDGSGIQQPEQSPSEKPAEQPKERSGPSPEIKPSANIEAERNPRLKAFYAESIVTSHRLGSPHFSIKFTDTYNQADTKKKRAMLSHERKRIKTALANFNEIGDIGAVNYLEDLDRSLLTIRGSMAKEVKDDKKIETLQNLDRENWIKHGIISEEMREVDYISRTLMDDPSVTNDVLRAVTGKEWSDEELEAAREDIRNGKATAQATESVRRELNTRLEHGEEPDYAVAWLLDDAEKRTVTVPEEKAAVVAKADQPAEKQETDEERKARRKEEARSKFQEKLTKEEGAQVDVPVKTDAQIAKEKKGEALRKAKEAALKLLKSFDEPPPAGKLSMAGTQQAELAFEVVSNLIEAGYYQFREAVAALKELVGEAWKDKRFQQYVEMAWDSHAEVNPDVVGRNGEKFEEETAEANAANTETAPEESAVAGQDVNVNPTEAQKEAGNYKKGHIVIDGLEISIENPVGSVRRGTDESGRQWEQELKDDYGYILGSKGKDKDHIDVFVKPGYEGGKYTAFIVNQINPKTGEFDEHKIMIGYETIEEARGAYYRNYEKGWGGLGNIVDSSINDLKVHWMDSWYTERPYDYQFWNEPNENDWEKSDGAYFKKGERGRIRSREEWNKEMDERVKQIKAESKIRKTGQQNIFVKGEGLSTEKPSAKSPLVTGGRGAKIPKKEEAQQSLFDVDEIGALPAILETGIDWDYAASLGFTREKIEQSKNKLREMQEKARKIPETYHINTPQRRTLRQITINGAYGTGAQKKERQLWLVLGLPAAGKSANLAEPLAEENGAILIDSDNYKKSLPEFNAGVGAAAVHRESSDIIEAEIYKRALRAGDNIVLPRLGKNIDTMRSIMETARKSGYRIHLQFVDLAPGKAAVRALTRFIETGRFVDPAMILRLGLTPKKNYGILKMEADTYAEYSSDVPKGDKIRPVSSSGVASGLRSGRRGGPDAGQSGGRGGSGEKPEGGINGTLEGTGPESLDAVSPEDVRGAEERGQTGKRTGESGGGVSVERPESGGKRSGRVRGPKGGAGTEHPAAGGRGRADSGRGDAGSGDVGPDGLKTGHTDGQGNYHITNADDLGGGNLKEKARRNIAAIKLLKLLESENRKATPEEQGVLVLYVGWGGIPQAVDDANHSGWDEEYEELKRLLTPEEHTAVKESTINAHYTSAEVVRAMWEAVRGFGFNGGAVLEPAAGTGNFFGLSPEHLQLSMRGIEMDSLTGRIAKQLYQGADIRISPYEDYDAPGNYYDLAISNVPFGKIEPYDRNAEKYGINKQYAIHDFYFLKTLYAVREGGIVAFITSRYTMDKKDREIRARIAKTANLLGAVRLPNNAFMKNANTSVVTDILFLQKRTEGELPDDVTRRWIDTVAIKLDRNKGEGQEEFTQNSYYTEHPEMIIGEQKTRSSQFTPNDYTVSWTGGDFAQALNDALGRLPKNVFTPAAVDHSDIIAKEFAPDNIGYGSIYLNEKGELKQRGEGGIAVEPLEGFKDRTSKMMRLKKAVRVKMAMRELLRESATHDDDTAPAIIEARRRLNREYDEFYRYYGAFHTPYNSAIINEDADLGFYLSLENYDRKSKTAKKTEIFTTLKLTKYKKPKKADNPGDALLVSLAETGGINWARMVELTGLSETELQNSLLATGAIFRDAKAFVDHSNDGEFILADEYLSGNVREKLKAAEEAAKKDARFQANVDVLRPVIPADLGPGEISIQMNSPVLDVEDVRDFITELFDVEKEDFVLIKDRAESRWTLHKKYGLSSSEISTQTLAAGSENGADILMMMLNNKPIRLMKAVGEDENGKTIFEYDEESTMLAKERADEIKNRFYDWLWKSGERSDRILRKYNDVFNATVPRNFQHPAFSVNKKAEVRPVNYALPYPLRKHQANAVWRIVQNRFNMLAHVVGAGKTLEMICGGMELRRLGLRKKCLYVVPNHMIEQWARDFRMSYPGARLLVATEKMMSAKNRKIAVNRIATGDWDAVVMRQSQFKMVGVSPKIEIEYLNKKVAVYQEAIKLVEAQEADLKRRNKKGKSRRVKDLEERLLKYKAKIKGLSDMKRDTGVLFFDELGIDQLFVDEADLYKNVDYFTQMQRIASLGSMRGNEATMDMQIKIDWLRTMGGGVTFATGTPISNTMAEAYHMMKYLQPDDLEQVGIVTFDDWKNVFGSIIESLETNNSGSGFVLRTRFAKFENVPELMAMLRRVWDIQTASMLENEGILVPGVNLPQTKRTFVDAPSYDDLKSYIFHLADREDEVKKQGKPEKGMDNVLAIIGDGRKAAVDLRLIDLALPDNPSSKLNRCVDLAYERWKSGQKERQTGVIFYDLTRPLVESGKIVEVEDDEVEGLGEYTKFDVQAEIKRKLVERGVPAKDIAFIHDANTDVRKIELFNAVNNGEIRILIGSTQKMGAGTNIQERLKWLIHLDAPWRPRDVEQREGRIVRQGNSNPDVEIIYLVAKGSYDTALWNVLEIKAKTISQVMAGKTGQREVEDEGGVYASAKVLSIDDPRIKEAAELDQDIRHMMALRRAYVSNQANARSEAARIRSMIKYYQSSIVENEQEIKDRVKKPEEFNITVLDQKYDKREKAGAQIILAVHQGYVHIGNYLGWAIETGGALVRDENFSLMLKKGGKEHTTGLIGNSPAGVIHAIEYLIFGRPEAEIKQAQENISGYEKRIPGLDKEAAAEFDKTDELTKKQAQLKRVQAEIESMVKASGKSAEKTESRYDWWDIERKRKEGKGGTIEGLSVEEEREEYNDFNNLYEELEKAYASGAAQNEIDALETRMAELVSEEDMIGEMPATSEGVSVEEQLRAMYDRYINPTNRRGMTERDIIDNMKSVVMDAGGRSDISDDDVLAAAKDAYEARSDLLKRRAAALGVEEIKAYHGSPYHFNRFRSDKIGSGEGAQAYGWGMYFTSKKSIAHHYYHALGQRRMEDEAGNVARWKVIDFAESLSDKQKAVLDRIAMHDYQKHFSALNDAGKMMVLTASITTGEITHEELGLPQIKNYQRAYTVTLHKGKSPFQYDYLKWDQYITHSQKKKLIKACEEEWVGYSLKEKLNRRGRILGEDVYRELVHDFKNGNSDNPKKDASLFLLRAGFDGIDYPAGRLSGYSSGERNYVVFDENAVTIDKISNDPIFGYETLDVRKNQDGVTYHLVARDEGKMPTVIGTDKVSDSELKYLVGPRHADEIRALNLKPGEFNVIELDEGVDTGEEIVYDIHERRRRIDPNQTSLFDDQDRKEEVDAAHGKDADQDLQSAQRAVDGAAVSDAVRGDQGAVQPATQENTPLGYWQKHRRIDYTGRSIGSPKDLAELFSVYRHPSLEHFHIIYLKDDTIVGHNMMCSGEAAACSAFDIMPLETDDSGNIIFENGQPKLSARWVYALNNRMKKLGADGFYIIHNHPAGTLEPSGADLSITKYYYRASPDKFRGHLILDHNEFNELFNGVGHSGISGRKWKYHGGKKFVKRLGKIAGPHDVAQLAREHIDEEHHSAVVVVNTNNEIYGVIPVSGRVSIESVYGAVRAHGGSGAFVITDSDFVYQNLAADMKAAREREEGYSADVIYDVVRVNTEKLFAGNIFRSKESGRSWQNRTGAEIARDYSEEKRRSTKKTRHSAWVHEPDAPGYAIPEERARQLETTMRSLRARIRLLPEEDLLARARIELDIANFKAEKLEIVKNAIYDYAKKIGLRGVPYNTVDTMLKNAQTAANLRKAVVRIDEIWEKFQHSKARKQLLELVEQEYRRIRAIEGKRVSTIELEANRMVKNYLDQLMDEGTAGADERMRRVMAFVNLYGKEQIKENEDALDNLGEGWRQWIEDPSIPVPSVVKNDIQALFRKNVSTMSTDQLKRTMAEILEIKKYGRTLRQIDIEKNRKTMNEVAEAVAEEIRMVHKFVPGRQLLRAVEGRKPVSRAARYFWSLIDAERIASSFVGWRKTSKIHQMVTQPIFDAEARKMRSLNAALKRFEEIHKGINIVDARSKSHVQFQWNVAGFDQPIPLTLSQMMFIYANSKNRSNLNHLLGTMGLPEELGILDIQAVIDALPEGPKRAVDAMIEYYDTVQYDRINRVFSDEHHTDMPRERNYFPIQNLKTDLAESAIVADIVAHFGAGKAAPQKGMTRSRVESKAPFEELDYFDVVARNLAATEHYIAYQAAVQQVDKFLRIPVIKEAMENVDPVRRTELMRWVKAAAHGRIDNKSIDAVSRALDFGRKHFTTYILGLKLPTVLMQLASLPKGLSKTDAGSGMQAAYEFAQNPVKVLDFVNGRSAWMEFRTKNFEHEVAEWTESDAAKKMLHAYKLGEKVQSTLREVAMWAIGSVDKVTATVVWYGKYLEMMKKGQGEEAAVAEADKTVRQTQSRGGIVLSPSIYRTNGFARAYMMFTSDLNQNTNMLLDYFGEWRGKSTWQKIVEPMMFLIIPTLIIGLIQSAMRRPDEQPEEYIKALVSQILGAFPIAGDIVESIVWSLLDAMKEHRGIIPDRGWKRYMGNFVPGPLKPFETLADIDPTNLTPGSIKSLVETGGAYAGLPVHGPMRLYKQLDEFGRTGDWRYLFFPEGDVSLETVESSMVRRAVRPRNAEDKAVLAGYIRTLDATQRKEFGTKVARYAAGRSRARLKQSMQKNMELLQEQKNSKLISELEYRRRVDQMLKAYSEAKRDAE